MAFVSKLKYVYRCAYSHTLPDTGTLLSRFIELRTSSSAKRFWISQPFLNSGSRESVGNPPQINTDERRSEETTVETRHCHVSLQAQKSGLRRDFFAGKKNGGAKAPPES